MDDWDWAVNDIRPTFIRMESDEATYNLHILLRFEMETAMMSGDLSVADVPGAWNEKMKKYLGITPPDDARGCLQDIHWSSGAIGYFATYTLGNLYAAQFASRRRKTWAISMRCSARVNSSRCSIGPGKTSIDMDEDTRRSNSSNV